MRVLPLASTGTVVSSAWMRSAAKTWARIASTSGISVAAAGADPVGQRRDVELDALAGVGVALPVERQMQAVLGEQHVGQQIAGPARPRGIGCDGAGGWVIASQARQENFSRTCWITFHCRGTSSSVSVTSSPSLRNGCRRSRGRRRRRIDDALARQMLGQRPARRLAPLESLAPSIFSRPPLRCHLRRRLGLGRVLFEVGELQLELLEERAALRGLAEPLVAQLGDRELQLLDQQRRRASASACAPSRCASRAARLRGSIIAFSVVDIIGKRIGGAHHRKMESQRRCACANPRSCSRFTIAAISRPLAAATSAAACRQSMPFEQIAELRRRDRHRAVSRRRPDEAAALQPLGEQAHALAVVPEHLDQTAATAAEHEQMAAVRIALELLLDQQRQAVEALAHVGVAGRQPHPHAARDRDHRRRLPASAP